MNIEDGIKRQRKLLAIIHDASMPCNPGYYESFEAPIYTMPQEEYNKLLEKFDKLAEELTNRKPL